MDQYLRGTICIVYVRSGLISKQGVQAKVGPIGFSHSSPRNSCGSEESECGCSPNFVPEVPRGGTLGDSAFQYTVYTVDLTFAE